MNFVFICDFLLYYNDTDTIALNRTNVAKILSQFTRIYSEILHESVKNTPKASTNHVRIKINSWLFLTICEIFSKSLFTPAWALLQK